MILLRLHSGCTPGVEGVVYGRERGETIECLERERGKGAVRLPGEPVGGVMG